MLAALAIGFSTSSLLVSPHLGAAGAGAERMSWQPRQLEALAGVELCAAQVAEVQGKCIFVLDEWGIMSPRVLLRLYLLSA